jgi:xanthine dehydrogenase small subunit
MENTPVKSAEFRFNEISFFLNGNRRAARLSPGISTLDFLNKELHLYGSKCSCNEGDCGACTVVISYPREGEIVYEAINSCLYPAAKLHGKHLITVEGLGTSEDLHPIQRALLDHHSTQCGYCTPGFVMSLFALLASIAHPDTESIMAALEGNLCRCTGYQSILDAAQELSRDFEPANIVPSWCRKVEALLFGFKDPAQSVFINSDSEYSINNYLKPESCQQLASLLNKHPEASLIAGGTDIMVQVNVSRRKFSTLIDLAEISELKNLQLKRDGIHIGAAVSYSRIMDSGIVRSDLPALTKLCRLIASKQIRNFGTLVGNIANASPIGDSLPLLLVYDTKLIVSSLEADREIPLQAFFLDYRKTALKPGEYIREIIIPIPPRDSFIMALKTAKRKSVDISSVVSAIRIDHEGQSAALAFGGVAATPVLSKLFAQQWKAAQNGDWQALAQSVASEFSPLSDVRGSAEYRRQMIINHILQYAEAYHG